MANEKVYIHEFIDITGANRARYMHHMTANWVPIAIEERNQLCYGVWGTVGSTGRWPEVVNLWELEGWEGLTANFEHELSHASLQDPSLAEWWRTAADLRRGGTDRIVVPAPWTRTITELVGDGVRGMAYAHEVVSTPAGGSTGFLGRLAGSGRAAVEALGLTLVGAFDVAMVHGTEAIVIWAIPDWPSWTRYEAAWLPDGALVEWNASLRDAGTTVRRTLMIEAPLSPMRLGRQPSVEDRRPLSEV